MANSVNIANSKSLEYCADPKHVDHLAVDSKKVQQIKHWLQNSKGKGEILLLTGPTGCGKTSTVNVVARSLGFDVQEWITPLDKDRDVDGGFQNPVERFEDFLFSASRYRNLFVHSAVKCTLLLVEDYPNIFLRDPERFHKVLKQYRSLAQSPIVFICSEVADMDLRIASQLFPSKLQVDLGISHITLNPVTKTNMTLALQRIISLLQMQPSGFARLSSDELKEISEAANGDIRSGLLALQMRSSKSVECMFDAAMNTQFFKKKRPHSSKESDAIKLCFKDDRIGLLHAVGRIIHPKWVDDEEGEKSKSKKRRRGTSSKVNIERKHLKEMVHDPSTFIDSFLSMSSTFTLFVQENYLNTYSCIDSVARAASYLSDADYLMTGEALNASHEMSFDLAVRGVMVSNKKPLRVWAPVKSSRHFNSISDRKSLIDMANALFPCYPSSSAVLMTEIFPYLYFIPRVPLSTAQRRLVHNVGSCKSNVRELLECPKLSKEDSQSVSHNMHPESKTDVADEEELHISEYESDEEAMLDQKNNKVIKLEAKEISKENYFDLLNDECDEDLLLLL